jgi:CBS domain-containing protein
MQRNHRTARPPQFALTAADIMQRQVVTVSPTAPLSEVERLLTENHISGMPVTNSKGRAIGVVSYRDLLDHYAENPDSLPPRSESYYRLPTEHLADEEFDPVSARESAEDRVEDVMTPEVIHVDLDTPLQEIARTMVERSVHRVLVLDPETGRVLGLISTAGVLAAFVQRKAARATAQ